MEAAVKVDEAVHGQWKWRAKKATEAYERKLQAAKESGKEVGEITKYNPKRQHAGPAQKAFDKIARANLFAITDQQYTVIRDERTTVVYKDKGAGKREPVSVTKVTGRSLLGYVNPRSVQHVYKPGTLKTQIRSAFDSFRKRYPDFEIGDAPRTRIIAKNADGSERLVLNSRELQEMFLDGFDGQGNSTDKNGFGLRVPISRSEFNGKTMDELELDAGEYLETRFSDITPPSVTVEFDKQYRLNDQGDTKPMPPKNDGLGQSGQNQEDHTGDNIDDILDEDDDFFALMEKQTGTKLSDPGKPLTESEMNALLNQFMPEPFWVSAKRWVQRSLGLGASNTRFARLMDGNKLAHLAGKEA